MSASGGRIPADSLTHVALVGRSNVGKSSLINALTGRALARTSAAPGKTRLVNIYRVELATGRGRIALYLVDLPGYGYARGGSRAADELRAVAEAYFSSRGSGFGARDPQAGGSGSRESRTAGPGPRGSALLLVDSRHPRLESDLQAARWLDSMGVTTHIAATKIDKLTRSERARNLTAIGDSFGTAVQPVSAANGEGLDALWRTIVRIARDEGRGG